MIIEGAWDCVYCGAKAIRGGSRECPQCGHPRDDNVTFYIADPNNVLSKEAEAKLNKNPDWVCPACNCLNSDSAHICVGCGTPKAESSENYFENQAQIRPTYQRERENWGDFHPDAVIRDVVDAPDVMEGKPQRRFPWGSIFKYSILALLIISLIAGGIWLFSPRETTGIVTGFSWERSIAIEEYKTVRESDWSLPAGARLISQSEELHHYDQVIDHYEQKTRTYTKEVLDHYERYISGYRDLGNGHFEAVYDERPVYRTETVTEVYSEPVYKSVPVYKTKYVYDIDKWVHTRDVKTSGDDKNPEWGNLNLSPQEREGSRTGTYTIVLQEDDEVNEYTLSLEQWQSLELNQTVRLRYYIGGKAEIIFE